MNTKKHLSSMVIVLLYYMSYLPIVTAAEAYSVLSDVNKKIDTINLGMLGLMKVLDLQQGFQIWM